MGNKKLTAVQELIEWVKKERDNTHKIELFRPKLAQLDALEELFKSKLELEKEQIIESCNAGLSGVPRSAEQYYKQTYEKNK